GARTAQCQLFGTQFAPAGAAGQHAGDRGCSVRGHGRVFQAEDARAAQGVAAAAGRAEGQVADAQGAAEGNRAGSTIASAEDGVTAIDPALVLQGLRLVEPVRGTGGPGAGTVLRAIGQGRSI